MNNREIIDRLYKNTTVEPEEFRQLLGDMDADTQEYLSEKARKVSRRIFGNRIYLRGLIEFTNYCKNDCFYCGIRRSNQQVERYHLSKEEILSCCKIGYDLGFRTFVLQGGEDLSFSDEILCDLIYHIKKQFPECAITLSIGEKSKESYQRYFEAGADRYLLRHETANEEHYRKLHPKEMSLVNRKHCLFYLKEIGYQVGCGIMVGSPYQTKETILEDLLFMKELKPHMIGIGPFITQKNTIFAEFQNGSVEFTLRLLSILRLMFPQVLLPATTALGTLDPMGREKGILAGANVLMPNLSPIKVREKYTLYDNKICTGEEAAECNQCLQERIKKIGYTIVKVRGDYGEIYK